MPNCYCLNPTCPQPENPPEALICKACGSPLLIRNRYRAFKRIGQGGFGATFLARDQDLPSKPWRVVKQLRPVEDSPQIARLSQELFNREAQVLEKLGEHSQIPKLFAHFEENTKFYLVQEFIQGVTLSHELHRNGPMSEDQVRQVMQEILLILSYVHSHNTVHRDIKPANLIRRKSDQRLVLIDFGAVKELDPTKETPVEATAIRSLGFSPPEQVAGQSVVPASDIYALGATCLNLLTMESPAKYFDPELSKWNWEGRLNLGKDFEDVLLKMLQPGLEERYISATEVLRALQGLSSADLGVQRPAVVLPSSMDPGSQAAGPVISDHWSRRTEPRTVPTQSGGRSASISRPSSGSVNQQTGGGFSSYSSTNHRQPATPPRVPSMAGADLRGRSMAGQNLAGHDLRKADLRGTDLSGANLQRADLRGVLFNTPQPLWVRGVQWLFGQAMTIGGIAVGLFALTGGAALSFWVVQYFIGSIWISLVAGLVGMMVGATTLWSFAGRHSFSLFSEQHRKRYTNIRRVDLRGAQMDPKFRQFASKQNALLERY